MNDQYLLIDTKFINLFQEMFEQVHEFTSVWEIRKEIIEDHETHRENILGLMDQDIRILTDIIKEFEKTARNDMIEKACQNMQTGEA